MVAALLNKQSNPPLCLSQGGGFLMQQNSLEQQSVGSGCRDGPLMMYVLDFHVPFMCLSCDSAEYCE